MVQRECKGDIRVRLAKFDQNAWTSCLRFIVCPLCPGASWCRAPEETPVVFALASASTLMPSKRPHLLFEGISVFTAWRMRLSRRMLGPTKSSTLASSSSLDAMAGPMASLKSRML